MSGRQGNGGAGACADSSSEKFGGDGEERGGHSQEEGVWSPAAALPMR